MQSTYDFTVPIFSKMLGGLKGVLQKGEAFAKEKGMGEEGLLSSALAPDMFPLVRQVQIACDHAKNGPARAAGIEAPKFEDTEKTFAELYARIDKTLAYLSTLPQDAFKNSADIKVQLSFFPGKYMTGFDYAREYVIPNFFFHVTTAYDILRTKGAQIGKADFIAGLPLRDF